jgi:LuxR family transcriptional regulator, maltose regulon positive regulatory protein
MSHHCPNCGAELGLQLVTISTPRTTATDRRSARGRFGLTRREGEVADLIVDGLNNMQIAAELKICEQAVKNYVYHIFDKVGSANRADMVRIVLLGRDGSK